MRRFYFLTFVCFIFGTAQSCKKEPNPEQKSYYRQGVGESSNQLLSAGEFDKLTVEIQYVEGFKPTQNAIDNLTTFLNARLNKPNGISVELKSISSPGKSTYSVTDIKNIEDATRTRFADGKTFAVYFLFLDGEYAANSGNGKVLGVAYRNTSMAIFEKTIHEFSDNVISEPPRDKLETTVINHELGHILGLVNTGTAMQTNHQDVEHGSHCNNNKCLMYWLAETSDMVSTLLGSEPVPGLDAACLADLKANGGK